MAAHFCHEQPELRESTATQEKDRLSVDEAIVRVTVIAIKLQLFNSTVKPNQLMRTEIMVNLGTGEEV